MKKPIPPAGEIDSVLRIRRVKFGYRLSIMVRVLHPEHFTEDEAGIVAFMHLRDKLRGLGYNVVRIAKGREG